MSNQPTAPAAAPSISTKAPAGPLDGVRVVDASQMMAGPYCGMRLGDLGAEVIKVEPPQGEWVRRHGFADMRIGGETVAFLALNRNKQSLAVDLKTDDGRRVVHDLVRASDVFIQNFRVGAQAKLGIDYDTLAAINPRLIYCSISGFGEEGPHCGRPAQDLLVQALSGSMWVCGQDGGPPQVSAFWPADVMTSHLATIGILSALYARQRTGRGQKVATNLLASLLDAESQELMAFMAAGELPQRSRTPSSAHALFNAPYGVVRTRDGYIALGTVPIARLNEAVADPRLKALTEARDGYARRDEVFAVLNEVMPRRSTREWLDLFGPLDVWAAPVQTYGDLIADEHVAATDMLTSLEGSDGQTIPMVNVPVHLSGTPVALRFRPPLLGEHTRDIVERVLGYDRGRVDDLVAAKVLASV